MSQFSTFSFCISISVKISFGIPSNLYGIPVGMGSSVLTTAVSIIEHNGKECKHNRGIFWHFLKTF